MHFYCFLVKEITKLGEIFTGWFYYISLDCIEAFTDTLPIVCNDFKVRVSHYGPYYPWIHGWSNMAQGSSMN